MRVAVLLPVLAAATCFEIALLFGFVYFRMKPRRREYAIFAGYSLCISWMIWWTLKLQELPDIRLAAFTFRLQFVGISVGVACLADLTTTLAQVRLPRWLRRRGVYLLGLFLSAGAWCPQVIHEPPRGTSLATFRKYNQSAVGPWFAPYAAVPMATILICCGVLVQALRRPTSDTPPSAWTRPVDLRLRRTLSVILLGSIFIVGSGAVEVLELFGIPSSGIVWWVNPRALSTTIYCVIVAWTLGDRVVLLSVEEKRAAALALTRYNAINQIHHDVNKKITAVIWLLRCLSVSVPDENNRGIVDKALQDAHELEEFTDFMLSYAAAEAGRSVALRSVREVDVERLVRSVAESCYGARTASQPDAAAVLMNDRLHLISRLREPVLELNTVAFRSVVANLVDNALKFSGDDTPIEITLYDDDAGFHVSVRDHGAGIEAAQVDRIFDQAPFSGRDACCAQGRGGYRVGLAGCRRLAEAAGGSLSAYSAGIGAGAEFTLTLPVSF